MSSYNNIITNCDVVTANDSMIECQVTGLPVGWNEIYIHVEGKGNCSQIVQINSYQDVALNVSG